MTELTINEVDVAKLNVQPGQVLMVKCKHSLRMEQAIAIRRLFMEAFEKAGGDIPYVLVVDRTVDLEVITREQAARLEERGGTDEPENTQRGSHKSSEAV
jgi:hypothetical protein